MTTGRAHGATVLGLRLRPDDDVAVVFEDGAAGSQVRAGSEAITALDAIPRGHKITLKPVDPSDPVPKYGQIIGFATSRIGIGDHVHTHDLQFRSFTRETQATSDARPTKLVAGADHQPW